jgi:hypothetical protein
MSRTTRDGVDETFTHRGFNAPVKVSADELANTMVDFFREITLSIPGAQVLRNDGVVAGISGVPSPAMNSVWLQRPDPEVADVASLLDEVAVRKVPFSLRLRPGGGAALAELAVSRGMTATGEVPLMAVDAATDIRSPDELSIRLLAPGEAAVHARLCTAGFGLPDDIARPVTTRGTAGADSAPSSPRER